MNILYIDHYAGTPDLGMEYRPYYLAREWVDAGHDVTILAADFSHYRMKQPTVNKDFEEQIVNKVRYLWVKTPHYSGNGFGRIRNMLIFICRVFFKTFFLVHKYDPDVVIASSTYPFDNYIARRISKISGAVFIYEVHDLWPLSPIELGGYSRYHPFILCVQHAENFAYKNADAVISILPETKSYMQQHGLDPKKWFFIPNGISVKEWELQEMIPVQVSEKINAIRQNSSTIVGYVGTHGLANALEPFIRAARLLVEYDIELVLVGDGPEKKKLIQLAREMNLSNVHFFDSVPKQTIPDLLKQFDILYLGWYNREFYKYGISSNKLLDYMMAGKPVIHSVGAGNDLVADAHCGISVPPEDSNTIADAILKLKSLPENELKEMGNNGKKYVLQNYDYNNLAQKYLGIIYDLD